MARAKSVSARRHRKIKKQAKGFKHARRKRVKTAKEAVLHAGQHAYIGRKNKKRDLRRLWITRLNAAARENGMSYSTFMNALKKNKIEIDRKVLSELAVKEPKVFDQIVKEIK